VEFFMRYRPPASPEQLAMAGRPFKNSHDLLSNVNDYSL